ncbi:MAG: LysM peptidoglycan-binding domain-containing protein, partial [Cyanobacteriota bacterium]|nr:LysM peptidoglycan-binding domain-containing protein [Cyanobacteriota bacterium]
AQDNFSSPDLTHRRLVRAGDTLPQLCLEIYGTAEHYLRVADVNNLDDVRVLTPGQQLLFPPYARTGG